LQHQEPQRLPSSKAERSPWLAVRALPRSGFQRLGSSSNPKLTGSADRNIAAGRHDGPARLDDASLKPAAGARSLGHAGTNANTRHYDSVLARSGLHNNDAGN
jgi:hypothetical protein